MLLFLIILLIILPPFAIDEYAASLPAMVVDLGTSIKIIQLTFSVYLFAQAASQIASGPISDRFGRKVPLIITLGIYLLGSIFCVIASTPSALLLGRLLQGLGMGCCAITAPALISDSFKGEEFAKASALVFITYSLVPIIAPIIGGYVQEWYGWRANFIVLLIFPLLVTILVWLRLPETHTPTAENSIDLQNLKSNYRKLLTNTQFLICTLTMAFLWSIIMVFSVVAPFTIQNILGFSASQYGHIALLVGLSFLLGTLVTRQISVSRNKLVIFSGAILQLVSAAVMLLLASLLPISIWLMVIPIILIIFANALIFPKLYALSLSIFPNLVGMASSLVGSVMLTGSVISTTIIAHLQFHSLFFIAVIYTVLSLFCVCTLMFLKFDIIEKI